MVNKTLRCVLMHIGQVKEQICFEHCKIRMNFTQSILFNILASGGLLVINMLIGVIEARLLGPCEMGRYNLFLTTQTMFVTLFAFGIGQSCIYFINSLKKELSLVVTTSIKFILPFSIVASLLLFIFFNLFQNYFREGNQIYLALFCVGTNALLINTILIPVLLANMQVVKNQVVKYISRLVVLFALLLLLLLHIQLEVGLLIALVGMTNVFSLILLGWYLRKEIQWKRPFDVRLLKDLLQWGIKLSGNNVANIVLSSIPVYFLSWFAEREYSLAYVGYYTRSSSLLVAGTLLITSVGPLIYAKWSTLQGEMLRSQVRKFSVLMLGVCLLISLVLIACSTWIILLLYGVEFNAAIPVLRILSLTLVFNSLKEVCHAVLSSQGQPLKIMKNLLIGAMVMALLMWFVIPIYGVNGCAFVALAVTAFTTWLLMKDVCKISLVRMSDFFCVPDKEEFYQIIRNVIKRKR